MVSQLYFPQDKFLSRLFSKASLEDELAKGRTDLESRTKKYDMQLAALTENLATVRGELKNTQEKLVHFDLLKTEKAGRLTVRKFFFDLVLS